MLIYFLRSLIFLNFITTIFTYGDLKINSEVHNSYNQAKSILSSILPKTLTSERQIEYDLLKKLDSQIESIIHSKSAQSSDDKKFKEIITECLETNNSLNFNYEKLLSIPNLDDPNNQEIDGNIFNIINGFNAYQKCLKTILNFFKLLENNNIPEKLN